MVGAIGWILFGLVVGVAAKIFMPGRDPGGFLATILLGLAGGFVGGLLGRLFGWYQEGDPVGFVMAVIGVVLLLLAYRILVKPSEV
ncbi:MAG TPA: GlsB/YeaQ/YmgE family stress response membrane protein [Nitrospira sp.]|nr:GlsB/YeaQ/YmgE family stress response membrane protein [Nitrospira sp.]